MCSYVHASLRVGCRLTLGDEMYKTTCKDNAGGKNVNYEETLSFKKNMEENILKVFCPMPCIFAYMYACMHLSESLSLSLTETHACMCI